MGGYGGNPYQQTPGAATSRLGTLRAGNAGMPARGMTGPEAQPPGTLPVQQDVMSPGQFSPQGQRTPYSQMGMNGQPMGGRGMGGMGGLGGLAQMLGLYGQYPVYSSQAYQGQQYRPQADLSSWQYNPQQFAAPPAIQQVYLPPIGLPAADTGGAAQ